MVIADTGFFIALANSADRYHDAVCKLREEVNEPLICTWPVLTETCHILLNLLGPFAAVGFMRSAAAGAFLIWDMGAENLQRIAPLISKYIDLPMDLADASLVLLAEHLGHGRIISTDKRDFRAYRWKRTKPFENLLADIPPRR